MNSEIGINNNNNMVMIMMMMMMNYESPSYITFK